MLLRSTLIYAPAIVLTRISALPAADILRLHNVPRQIYGQAHSLSAARFLTPMGHAATSVVLRDAEGTTICDPSTVSAAKDVRRKLRKLAAQGDVRFYLAQSRSERSELVEAMLAFRRARFGDLGRQEFLDDPSIEAFYCQLAKVENSPVALFGLKVNDGVVGLIYGLLHQGSSPC
ncbi:MAG TPA: GNAT family N-acetyltransferase [Devosia sp.]|nr:GNAT family N-acetyltransferase [Devosia sp.]